MASYSNASFPSIEASDRCRSLKLQPVIVAATGRLPPPMCMTPMPGTRGCPMTQDHLSP